MPNPMDNIIPIMICLLSLAGLVAILTWRVSYNRRNKIDFNQVSDYSIAHLVVDYIAFRLVYLCKQVVTKGYLFLLFFLRNSLSIIRYLIIRLEKRFYRFTESIKEKEKVIHQGKVSSFLKEIREHKESVSVETSQAEVIESSEAKMKEEMSSKMAANEED